VTGNSDRYTVVIVGGGAAGITVAAMLLRKARDLDIAIIEPSEKHYYQAAFTLVGGGAFAFEKTVRRERDLIPKGAQWIKEEAAEFAPDTNTVRLRSGKAITYDALVVCPGIQIDLDKVEGLKEALGKNGVCSNYLPEYAPYTWECIQRLGKGDVALFTQPPLPIKCPGAPQKIAYLCADHLRRKGLLDAVDIEFCNATDVMFSVPYFAGPLFDVAKRYGIKVNFNTNLRAVNGDEKMAVFAVKQDDGSVERVEKKFDMIHVSPPQSAPDFIKRSPLANDAGWVDVDQNSMRHKRYANVFALGDAGSTPNSKTAAAVRKQAPAVVTNLLATLRSDHGSGTYDGYASCPLTTAYGKVMLAEFCYGGKVTPTFPLDPKIERRSMWWFKAKFLPYLYWSHMLKGKEFDIRHKERRVA
jgi:sulfide:quinone oxidoreductase